MLIEYIPKQLQLSPSNNGKIYDYLDSGERIASNISDDGRLKNLDNNKEN